MSVLGHRVQRLEDPPLLTGRAAFLADHVVEGMLHAVFVRSSVAHGTVRDLDVSGAREAPGVVAVFTGADIAADKVGGTCALAVNVAVTVGPGDTPDALKVMRQE